MGEFQKNLPTKYLAALLAQRIKDSLNIRNSQCLQNIVLVFMCINMYWCAGAVYDFG